MSYLFEVPSNLVYVASRFDFPASVGGVITLEDFTTYLITDEVDLGGDRIVINGSNTTLLGTSSETSFLTSSGIGTTFPTNYLIESDYTLPIRHITFKDVPLGIGINTGGSGAQPIALDWTGVNFSGTTISLVCGDIDNFIFSKGAILSAGGFVFEGDVGTIGIDNSLFVGTGGAYDLIELTSSANVTRRFRTIYSSFVAFGSTVAINVSTSSVVPVDSYILDTCNFSGGGTYLQGIGQFYTDNEPRFVNCKGITNTAEIANYTMLNNATATVISAVNTPTKVLGTTTANAINQKFTHSNNRATYSGELVKDFQITAVASLFGSSNRVIGMYVAKNGSVITTSEMYATTSGSGRAESVTVQTITELVNGDYLEIWVENSTDSTNVTVEYLNFICKSIS